MSEFVTTGEVLAIVLVLVVFTIIWVQINK